MTIRAKNNASNTLAAHRNGMILTKKRHDQKYDVMQ